MTDPLLRLALEAPSDQAAKRILEGGKIGASSRLSAAAERQVRSTGLDDWLDRTPGINPDGTVSTYTMRQTLGSHYEVSPREREDEERRNRHDEGVDPWGNDDAEEPPKIVEPNEE